MGDDDQRTPDVYDPTADLCGCDHSGDVPEPGEVTSYGRLMDRLNAEAEGWPNGWHPGQDNLTTAAVFRHPEGRAIHVLKRGPRFRVAPNKGPEHGTVIYEGSKPTEAHDALLEWMGEHP